MNSKPTLNIPRIDALDALTDPSEITALLDDKGARADISQVNWPDACSYRPMTTVAIAYSKTAIYIDYLVRCNYLRAENYTDQSAVSEDSCVEFFVEPMPGGDYWNFEFNCIGTINASHRKVRPNPTRLTSEELNRVKRYASCGTRPFREIEGLFTWSLLVVIPLDLMGLSIETLPDSIRANFNKCASATSDPHFLTWSPINTEKPDFHRPEFFGTLYFEKP